MSNSSIVKYKTCSVCGMKLRESAFYPTGSGYKMGKCKTCYKKYRESLAGYCTDSEIRVLKKLSPENRLNYYRTMYRRDNWDTIDPSKIKTWLYKAIRADGFTGVI